MQMSGSGNRGQGEQASQGSAALVSLHSKATPPAGESCRVANSSSNTCGGLWRKLRRKDTLITPPPGAWVHVPLDKSKPELGAGKGGSAAVPTGISDIKQY